jgi:hypothetical protein
MHHILRENFLADTNCPMQTVPRAERLPPSFRLLLSVNCGKIKIADFLSFRCLPQGGHPALGKQVSLWFKGSGIHHNQHREKGGYLDRLQDNPQA